MTVKELIEWLEGLNQDSVVHLCVSDDESMVTIRASLDTITENGNIVTLIG